MLIIENCVRRMAIAAGKKAFQDNAFNNEKIVLEIVKLRHQTCKFIRI